MNRPCKHSNTMALSTDYPKDFDPEWYLKTYYSTATGAKDEGDFLRFTLDSLHYIFDSGNVNGKTLLDIGTGPSIHSVISASKHVQDIYVSDYAEQNRTLLKSWWKGEYDGAYEEDIFKYIIEKENSGEDVAERSSLLKNKIKNIIPIDLTLQHPIQADNVPNIYDVVVSSLCLEAASLTKDDYISCVKKVRSLINSGGYLVIIGVLNETFYKVGEINFHCLKISKEEIQRIYEDAGFDIQFWRDLHQEDYLQYSSDQTFSDHDGIFAMMARKKI